MKSRYDNLPNFVLAKNIQKLNKKNQFRIQN